MLILANIFLSGTATEAPPIQAFTKEEIREHGWAEPVGYDYSRYQRNNAPRAGTDGAVVDGTIGGDGDGIAVGDSATDFEPPAWESAAARYEWKDDYGDIGPAFPELEKILFGDEDHVRAGPNLVQ